MGERTRKERRRRKEEKLLAVFVSGRRIGMCGGGWLSWNVDFCCFSVSGNVDAGVSLITIRALRGRRSSSKMRLFAVSLSGLNTGMLDCEGLFYCLTECIAGSAALGMFKYALDM